MLYLLALLLMLTACAEMKAIDQYSLERDKRKHQEMVEKGAKQLEQAELQAKARKAKEEQEALDKKAYYEWYDSLSYADKMKETRYQLEQQQMKQEREDRLREQEANRQMMREAAQAQERAAAMQAIGMINFGRGIFGPSYTPPPVIQHYNTPVPAYNPPPIQLRQGIRCTSTQTGNQVLTNCY